jgi:hypothetical protein
MRAAPVSPAGDVATPLGNLNEELRPFVAERPTKICRLERVGRLTDGFFISLGHRRYRNPAS